jgi:hypothetical protein
MIGRDAVDQGIPRRPRNDAELAVDLLGPVRQFRIVFRMLPPKFENEFIARDFAPKLSSRRLFRK